MLCTCCIETHHVRNDLRSTQCTACEHPPRVVPRAQLATRTLECCLPNVRRCALRRGGRGGDETPNMSRCTHRERGALFALGSTAILSLATQPICACMQDVTNNSTPRTVRTMLSTCDQYHPVAGARSDQRCVRASTRTSHRGACRYDCRIHQPTASRQHRGHDV